MINNFAVVGLLAVASSGVISLSLVLRFLWRVYERGGVSHLRVAAQALAQVRPVARPDSLGRRRGATAARGRRASRLQGVSG